MTDRLAKAGREASVLLDWWQNDPSRSTIAPYSPRARARPTVATPITWAEVARAADGEPLAFRPEQVVERVERLGDLWSAPRPGTLPRD